MCLYESLSVLLVIGLEGTMCKLHPVADGGYGMDDPGNKTCILSVSPGLSFQSIPYYFK